jgi:hypothetical protein
MKVQYSFRALIVSLVALAPAMTLAQVQTTAGSPTGPGYGLRRAGEREVTIGGSGASNRQFDNSFGGVNFSYGAYLNENNAWAIRQSINYSNPDVGGTQWQGSTRVAFDYHIPTTASVRPFVGANFGGVYGDALRDTLAAGLEGGLKFYVQPRTFIYGIAEYGWFFRHARSIDNTFRDGAFNWSLGLGYNF